MNDTAAGYHVTPPSSDWPGSSVSRPAMAT